MLQSLWVAETGSSESLGTKQFWIVLTWTNPNIHIVEPSMKTPQIAVSEADFDNYNVGALVVISPS